MLMQPPFGAKPLWYQCVLLAILFLCCFAITGAFTLIIPLLYHIPVDKLAESTGSNGFVPAMRLDQVIGAVGIMLLPALLFYRMTRPEPFKQLGLTGPNNAWFYLVAALIALASIPMVQLFADWNQHLRFGGHLSGLDKWIHDTEESNDDAINHLLLMPRTIDLIINLVVMALVPAICEEAFFRGVLQRLFIQSTRSPLAGILIGAAVFSALHGQFLGFFSRAALGIVLGYLYYYSGSLWPGIVAHFVYNGFQVVYFFIQQQHGGSLPTSIDNNASFPLSYGLLSTAFVIAGLFVMKRLPPTKRSSWL